MAKNYIDITGYKYGKLIVVKRTNNIRNRVAWYCKCECGNNTTATSNDLRAGNKRSYGRIKR